MIIDSAIKTSKQTVGNTKVSTKSNTNPSDIFSLSRTISVELAVLEACIFILKTI